MLQSNKKVERPLSPHLQVYDLPLTAKTSIMHRMSGVVLSLGMVLIIAFLVSAAMGEESYNCMIECLSSIYGRIVLFGWSMALFYHMVNGMRHMIWDTGAMLDKKNAEKSGYYVIALAGALVFSCWFCATNIAG